MSNVPRSCEVIAGNESSVLHTEAGRLPVEE